MQSYKLLNYFYGNFTPNSCNNIIFIGKNNQKNSLFYNFI
jgi:hypothetical protein